MTKKVSKDFFLNIVASLFSTGIMQLIVYPKLARTLPSDEYGMMLTVMGYVSVITLAFGNNLCNARLLQENKYKEKGVQGDFQLLVLLACIISSICIIICCIYLKLTYRYLLCVVILTIFTVLKSYYLVTYRININYKNNLIANIVIGIGYTLGVLLVGEKIGWTWAFFCGSFLGLVYIFFSSNIIKERFKKTQLFKESSKVAVVLLISGLVSNIITYLDRFIIFPVLGGDAVSIYTTAAFFPKSINLILTPITSVLLSYLTTGVVKINKRRYLGLNSIVILLGIVFFVISITLGKIITELLYPTLIGDAKPYIIIVSLGIIIGVVTTFSDVIVLAYAPVYWQTVIPCIRIVIYLVSCYLLILKNGLIGLCNGVVITNLISLMVSSVVGLIYTAKKEGKK